MNPALLYPNFQCFTLELLPNVTTVGVRLEAGLLNLVIQLFAYLSLYTAEKLYHWGESNDYFVAFYFIANSCFTTCNLEQGLESMV